MIIPIQTTGNIRTSLTRSIKFSQTTIGVTPACFAKATLPPRPGFAARIGSVGTMCCGTTDHHSKTGTNCAFVAPLHKCAGELLACEKASDEYIDSDGNGSCEKTA